jgi:hypothetical protein
MHGSTRATWIGPSKASSPKISNEPKINKIKMTKWNERGGKRRLFHRADRFFALHLTVPPLP